MYHLSASSFIICYYRCFFLILLVCQRSSVEAVWMTDDCNTNEHKDNPRCLCKNPTNWEMEICQEILQPSKNIEKKDQIGTKIVGGELAPKDAYPWFVRLVDKAGWWRGCGGMLVTKQYVLTAGHCVSANIVNNLAVEIGSVCPFQSNNCGQPLQQINVERVIRHPQYNPNTVNNDFALLKLSSRASAEPVPMDQGQFVDNYSPSKRNLYAIGFGALKYQGSTSSKLRHVEVGFVPRNRCNEKYSGGITQYMMCASDPGQDACQGDSGGPLYDAENEVLVGIVSWGNECALPGFPGVYAQISTRWNWIKTNICSSHSNPKPSFCGNSNSSPAPSPPSNSPCTNGGLGVEVSVITDNFPREIAWTIKSGDVVKGSSGLLSASYQEYVSNYCLSSSECYTFKIEDEYGDGIVYANGGGFRLSVNGENALVNSPYLSSFSYKFGDCLCDLESKISITTDSWPQETSWTLGSSDGKSESSGTLYVPNGDYVSSFCLSSKECHTFTINDSYGDGITGFGEYSLTVNDNSVLTNESFGYSKTAKFGTCTENEGSSTYSPTRTPTHPPSPLPTSSPTSPIKDEACSNSSKERFSVNLHTDEYGSQTIVKVQQRRKSGKFNRIRFKRGPFQDIEKEYNFTTCLNKNQCYKFVVTDRNGDGLCCTYGNGSFQGYWNGLPIENEDPVFSSGHQSWSKTFGKC